MEEGGMMIVIERCKRYDCDTKWEVRRCSTIMDTQEMNIRTGNGMNIRVSSKGNQLDFEFQLQSQRETTKGSYTQTENTKQKSNSNTERHAHYPTSTIDNETINTLTPNSVQRGKNKPTLLGPSLPSPSLSPHHHHDLVSRDCQRQK